MNRDGSFEDNSQSEWSGDLSIESIENNMPRPKSREPRSEMGQLAQIARMEARLDEVLDVVRKIHRTVISLTKSTNDGDAGSNQNLFLKFPLMTDDALANFEEDLKDYAFRQEVVSIEFLYLFV